MKNCIFLSHKPFLNPLCHSDCQILSVTVLNRWKKEIPLLVSVIEGNRMAGSQAVLTLAAGGGRQDLLLMTSADESILSNNTAALLTFVYRLFHLRGSLFPQDPLIRI